MARKISGHKPRSIFERYNIISGDVQEAMQALVTAGLSKEKSIVGETRKPMHLVKSFPGEALRSEKIVVSTRKY